MTLLSSQTAFAYDNPTQPPYFDYDWYNQIMKIECFETDATIYYTTDGSTPTHASTVYSAPFRIEHNMMINAMAWTESGGDSDVAGYEINSFAVPEPELVQDINTYTFKQTLEGASTKYTLDGSDPRTSTTAILYDGNKFEVMRQCTLMAYSYKENFNDSPMTYHDIYPETVYMPFVSTFLESNLVMMECQTPGATIHYTLDGSTPTIESAVYTNPVKVEHNLTVKAIACCEGYLDSDVATCDVNWFYVPEPELHHDGYYYYFTNSMEGVSTKYTLDESDPKTSATAILYDGNKFEVMKECTLMAYSYKENFNDSQVMSYSISPEKADMPFINFFPESNLVTMECQTPGATIHYTLDGSTPTIESAVYTNPVKVEHNLTVKAIACSSGYEDSEVATCEVNWFYVPEPELVQDINTYSFKQTLEGVSTQYTLDGSDPRTSSTAILYDGNKFEVMQECTLMAYSYKENFNDSQVMYYPIYPVMAEMPFINVFPESNLVMMECQTPGATIHYTLDGSIPTIESAVYTNPVKVEHNLMVKAIACCEGYVDSDVATCEVNWFYVPAPELHQDGYYYYFTNSMEGASTKYTLDSTDPRKSSTAILYDGNPFEVTANSTILAYSFKENFTDSQVVPFSTNPKCPNPEVAGYDGHYVTLSCPDSRATIYYNDQMTGKETAYTAGEKIGLTGINALSFYAIIEGSDMDRSDYVYFEPDYYSNEEEIQLRKPGLAAKAMEWQPDNNSANLKVVTYDENWAPFALDNSDFGYIRSKAGLKHLDLTETANTTLPDGAFQNMQLISLILPSTLTDYGKNTLSGCNSLSSVTFLANSPLPANLLDSKTPNPNMMLFVEKKANADLLPAGSCNVLAKYGSGYRADNVSLTHGYPFYYNQIFHAVEISYSRDFNKTTPLGGCAGWEGICIPFDVESIRFGEKELKPFGYWSDDDTLNFWLYSYEQNIWSQASYIFANRAYLISMPNNENYLEGYSISGTVTFSASNKDLYPNDYDPNGNSQLKANYAEMEASDDVMTLNDYSYMADGTLYEPGSVFVAGERGAKPFEAYMLNENDARYMKVFDGASADEMPAAQGFNVWTEGNDLCIVSSIDARVRIFDTTGRLVRIAEVHHGETCRVQGLTAGIYIAGNRKIYVRK